MSEHMKDKTHFFTSRAFFSSIGISLIFTNTLTSFWISEVIGIIISVLILLIAKNKSIKIIKYIVGFLLSTVSMIILVNMGHTLYLNETPIFALTLLPVIAVLVLSTCPKSAFLKTAQIFFICSLSLFLLKIIGLVPHFSIDNLKPFNIVGFKEIIMGSLIFSSISLTPVLYLNDLSNKKEAILNYLISAFTTFVVSVLAMGVLGLKEVTLYRNPEYIVLKKINFLDFINNVDSFFNFAILLDLLFTSSLGLRIMNIKSKKVLFVISVLILICTNAATHNYDIVVFIYYNLPYIFIVLLLLQLFLPNSKYKNENKVISYR